MKSIRYISHNEDETKKLAVQIASKLKIGDIIVLTGELGSGKTKFTEGFLSYFNLDKEISSPTFTIVNEYKNSNISIGGDEYFSSGISIIEWGELIKDALPKDYIEIVFHKDDNNENLRILDIYFHGKTYII